MDFAFRFFLYLFWISLFLPSAVVDPPASPRISIYLPGFRYNYDGFLCVLYESTIQDLPVSYLDLAISPLDRLIPPMDFTVSSIDLLISSLDLPESISNFPVSCLVFSMDMSESSLTNFLIPSPEASKFPSDISAFPLISLYLSLYRKWIALYFLWIFHSESFCISSGSRSSELCLPCISSYISCLLISSPDLPLSPSDVPVFPYLDPSSMGQKISP
jgi:hypothetical protein